MGSFPSRAVQKGVVRYRWVKNGQKWVGKVNLVLAVTRRVVPALHLTLPPAAPWSSAKPPSRDAAGRYGGRIFIVGSS